MISAGKRLRGGRSDCTPGSCRPLLRDLAEHDFGWEAIVRRQERLYAGLLPAAVAEPGAPPAAAESRAAHSQHNFGWEAIARRQERLYSELARAGVTP